jgi:lipopolysaccharide export system protein LptC
LVIAVLMGVLTIWLDEITRPSPHGKGLRQDKPEYQVESFNSTRYAPDGRISEQLSAASAWKYPGRPEVFARTVDLKDYDQGALAYNVTGESARYNPDTRIVVFELRVDLFQPAGKEKAETRVHTSALTLNTVQHTAVSPAPVRIEYGKSTVSGVGFSYNQHTGILQLFSKAKATYVP